MRLAASAVGLIGCLSGCAVVNTGANVVKAGASVVGTAVGAASTVAGAAVTTIGVAASTAGAAKSVAVSTAGVAVAAGGVAFAAGTFVVTAATSAANGHRADDIATASVVAIAPDRFSASDGRIWITRNCGGVANGQPALWVARRSGENEIRVNEATTCVVITAQ